MNQKGNSLIYILLGLLVVIVLLIPWPYYLSEGWYCVPMLPGTVSHCPHKGWNLGQPLWQRIANLYKTDNPQDHLTIPVTPTPDPTADWKTYTDQKLGISIKYPGEYFKYEKDYPGLGMYIAPSQGDGGNGSKFLKLTDVWINVSTLSGANISSIDEYIGLQGQGDFYKSAQKMPIMIGGVSGNKINYSFAAVAGNVMQYNLEGVVLYKGIIYKITMSAWNQDAINSNQTMFDQVLATFKFKNLSDVGQGCGGEQGGECKAGLDCQPSINSPLDEPGICVLSSKISK